MVVEVVDVDVEKASSEVGVVVKEVVVVGEVVDRDVEVPSIKLEVDDVEDLKDKDIALLGRGKERKGCDVGGSSIFLLLKNYQKGQEFA